jgi:tripartite-type tricarboxylate transporter receptor subunit TctC
VIGGFYRGIASSRQFEENAMRHRWRRFPYFAAAAAALATLTLPLSSNKAWTQAPRTIKIIVPVAPGGPTDTLARVLAEQIGRANGLTVIVEDRPGAGSVIGTEAVARAAPDGNTLLLTTPAFALNPHLRKLAYDPLTGFEPICHLVDDPTLIVVNTASPYRSFADLIAAARAKPGDVSVASVGPATASQLAVEMLKRDANVNMNFIPYNGYAPSIAAVLGGHVTAALVDYSAAIEQLKAGSLRPLVTTARKRSEQLPDLPTVAEIGYPNSEVDIWFGLTAPAKTSKQTVAELVRWSAGALQDGEIRAKLLAQGLIPVGACGADFAAFLRRQYETYGRLVRESHMKAE